MDNRSGELATWDDDMLMQEIQGLSNSGFDLELTGFDKKDFGIGIDPLDEMPTLPDGDKEPFQQMTFTFHDDQAEQVKTALRVSKDMGDFEGPNENSNGNALARICEVFLTNHG